ncbi:MAG: endonuclease III [Anaerohalosphaeraceae bacterium]|nr:endonuclease III [Anaerohalosphaeraceae bacterium]
MTKTKLSKIDKAEAKKRIQKICPILAKTYPDARCALEHKNPLQLLVATILSAQCTDVRVNIVTKELFKKYKTAKDFADADIKQMEQNIKSTGFYRNKSSNIKTACQRIVEAYNGKVPKTMYKLLELKGVGRKTANVILGNCFGVPSITCDTHMIRLARRLQLSENSDAVKLEYDLMKIVPEKKWTIFSHLIVFHGRGYCKARKPDCANCPIAEHCAATNNSKFL